jgi:uncharacterized membrane protein SpoIIM required for sporulation
MVANSAARRRRADCERLRELLDKADLQGLSALAPVELETLGSLYRQASTYLARARTDGRDPALVDYLNSLVGRAHGRVYGGQARGRFRPGHFFGTELPRTFRRHIGFIALSYGLSIAAAVIAFVAVAADGRWAQAMLPGGAETMVRQFAESDKPAGQYFAETASEAGGGVLSGFLMTHNIEVALKCFAFGITAGLGTVFALVQNGLMVGGFLGLGIPTGRLVDMTAVISPHGVTELSAVFIAGGAGLMLGYAIIAPGDRLRRDALVEAAREAVKLAVGTVPMFVCAGLIEGLVSPQYEGLFASNAARIVFGCLVGAVWYLYLFAGDKLLGALKAEKRPR